MLSRIKKSDISNEITRYDELNKQIKYLEKQRENLKNSLVASYFSKHSEYLDQNGVVRATYYPEVRKQFDTSSFKTDHAKLYADYCNDQTIYKFLIK